LSPNRIDNAEIGRAIEVCDEGRSVATWHSGSMKSPCNTRDRASSTEQMSDTVWKVMVDVQVSRRERPAMVTKPLLMSRRKRATTLRSIRELLIDDHYALLAAGKY
jgi:hypothetical protein